jgi:hypothetical protein
MDIHGPACLLSSEADAHIGTGGMFSGPKEGSNDNNSL